MKSRDFELVSLFSTASLIAFLSDIFFVLLRRIKESGLWSDDMIERKLSRSERNNVSAAYIYTSEHMDERRLMVQWRVDYLNGVKEEYIPPYELAKF